MTEVILNMYINSLLAEIFLSYFYFFLGTCGRPGRTNMSNYDPSGTREFNVNDKIRYKCTEKNHVILGNPERSCQRNGSWSDEIPVCCKFKVIMHSEIFRDSNKQIYKKCQSFLII